MDMTMVTWVQADGTEARTHVYTSELHDFTKDVNGAGGSVLEFHTEA